jgi:hypothetical protein
MTVEALVERNFNTAEHKWPVFREGMHVVANTR